MSKNSAALTSLLIGLIFIVGCPSIESKPIESVQAGPTTIESPKAEPSAEPTIESSPQKTEPTKAETPISEPAKPQPKLYVSFHDKCADILKEYVNEEGMVDYDALKKRKLQLKNLLDEFAGLDPNEYNSWPKEDKIAFWINAYNMQLLNIIVSNYPIQATRIRMVFWPPTSIRHIPGIWDTYKFIVMDEEFTLGEIERRFFRQGFTEPRVFLALSYASLSSPPLRNEPYYGHKLYEQLDDQARKFLLSPNGLYIDRNAQIVYISPILKPAWFGNEFVSMYGTDKKFKDQQPPVRAILNFITNYISKEDVSFLEIKNYSVDYLKYDWRLNEQTGK